MKDTYQDRIDRWMLVCFGIAIARDRTERNRRFLEEALELVQSLGCSRADAHALVDYVFDRPDGEPGQEVGGVMVTLAALCTAADLSMDKCGERELTRIWAEAARIQAKHAAKPEHLRIAAEEA